MDRRKTLVNEYKQRKIVGGVFRVMNTHNGMYHLGCTPNLQAKQNSFGFMVSTGTCFHPRLKKDWEASGGGGFAFEVLETIEKKKAQSQEEFLEDLETLKQIWSEKLDSSKRY